MDNVIILKGSIIDTPTGDSFRINDGSYIIAENGIVEGIYSEIPEKFRDCGYADFGNALIIPSFTDLHVHAPQITQRGIGMDMELIDWLNMYTFKSERGFEDIDYAAEVYSYFASTLLKHGTLRSCIFGTTHQTANEILIQKLDERGLIAYVGKVNMDQNAPRYLTQSMHDSLMQTRNFILKYRDNPRIKPMITPRFAPSCSHELLMGLGKMAEKYQVPVQSHLSENLNEVQWVRELFPEYRNYSEVYREHGLFGQTPTIMAHGIYLEEDEIDLIKESGVMLAHCPDSNLNLASGIMRSGKYLDSGLKVGIGSDVGAGHSIAMNQVIIRAIQSSKINYTVTKNSRIISHSEAFFMATRGNGGFFGNTGCFEKGFSFDALVISDPIPFSGELTSLERLFRFLYCGDDRNIEARFLEGRKLVQ